MRQGSSLLRVQALWHMRHFFLARQHVFGVRAIFAGVYARIHGIPWGEARHPLAALHHLPGYIDTQDQGKPVGVPPRKIPLPDGAIKRIYRGGPGADQDFACCRGWALDLPVLESIRPPILIDLDRFHDIFSASEF